MLRQDKIQVWANVSKAVDERLEALKLMDPVIFSKSRVISRCVDKALAAVEVEAQSFLEPEQEAPTRRRR